MSMVMISCKRATELIEKKTVFPLSFKENLQFILHRKMCSTCSAYYKSSKSIDSSLDQLFKESENIENKVLSEESKAAILKKIQKNQK